MSQAIKARILKAVRGRIQAGVNQYICFALDEIAAQDHRRNIQQLCDEIRADVLAHLAPCKTFGDALAWRATTLVQVKQARLAWLDAQINLCKEPA